MGAVCYQSLGCPDLGVSTSGFEPLSLLLGIRASEARSSAATTFKAVLKSSKA
jgi:hypothetical protein